MQRLGAIPAFFNTQQQGQNCLEIGERPRDTKKHTAPLGDSVPQLFYIRVAIERQVPQPVFPITE